MTMLEGIRIVSFNHFFMGPAAIQLLGDLGADVISVEPLEGAFQRKWGGADKKIDGQTMLFIAANRNKRSLALELKDPRGLKIARELVTGADVVAENFRPGVMEKLGLGYEDIKALKPDVIYASGSGFGPDGPYASRPGQDLIIQAMSGLAAITGSRQHGPRAVGVSAADHHGAALMAMGILAALLRRARTGEGSRIDVNLLSAAIDLQVESFTCYLNGERPADIRQPESIAGWYFPAPYGIYATSDGHVAISLSPLPSVYDALDIPVEHRISEADAYVRRDEIAAILADRIRTAPTARWLGVLQDHKIWHAPVNDYAAVVEDPQVTHNGSFVKVPGATGSALTLVAHPVRYDGQVPKVRFPPQPLGAQTREVLAELGYTPDQTSLLEREKIVYATEHRAAEKAG